MAGKSPTLHPRHGLSIFAILLLTGVTFHRYFADATALIICHKQDILETESFLHLLN